MLVALAFGCSEGGSSGGASATLAAESYVQHAARNDQRGFTDRFLADLTQRYPEGHCANGGPRTVVCGDAEISLDRVWNYCVDNAGGCDATVTDFADGMATALREQLAATDVTREQLRVGLRTRAYADNAGRLTDGAILRPAFGDLVAFVMVDSPTTARGYGTADARALGLDAAAAYDLALANTLAELGDLPSDGALACGAIVAVTNRSFYESTRLLDPRLFGGATTTLRAPMLVAVPTYDAMLLTLDCGAESRATLTARAAQLAAESPLPLTNTLFRVTAEGITALAL